MYQITVLETTEELFEALNNNIPHDRNRPGLESGKVELEYDHGSLFLRCSDDRFDIDKIDVLDVLGKALSDKNIKFVITDPPKEHGFVESKQIEE